MSKRLNNDQIPAYSSDPWLITEENFTPARNALNETIFALSNGYMGTRGNFEEGLPETEIKTIDGIYLNGFYESVPIPYAETGYGYAANTQTILNVTNSRIIELYLDDERFSLTTGTILEYKRTLDMKNGYLIRDLVWRSPKGKEIHLIVRRLVSFTYRHLMAFDYQVRTLNFSGKITINSSLDGAVDNHTHEEEDPRFSASLKGLGLSVNEIIADKEPVVMVQKTCRSKLTLACAMDHQLLNNTSTVKNIKQENQAVTVSYQHNLQQGERFGLEKYVAYYTSLDYPVEDLTKLASQMTAKGLAKGFDSLLEEQSRYLGSLWDKAGINIKMNKLTSAEQALRFNLFHLFQTAGSTGKTGIGAKGLTSEGYDGHYFWDTEIYMIPFYAALMPEEARKLLEYRYNILDHAREKARILDHSRGALYPWRTIAGEEGSSYYPAGAAQYHINAAMAYAINKYVEMTGDFSFILEFGAEIIFETARLWEDLGAYIPRRGNRFCYNEVTGPDEYTALVNNNFYTNLMAQWHLNYAYETASNLKKNYPAHFRKVADKIKLNQEELQGWQKAAMNMFIPYDHTLQIHPQDDSFLEKETWDFKSTPAERYPLLLNYHPLVIYRYQVCKQPDVILAHFLLADRFGLDQKCRDYNYYEPITTHDSSLSPSIFGIVASELGFYEDAQYFFALTLRFDLDNCLNDTHYGAHIANMAGSWMNLVYGFAGMRTTNGRLSFNPYLPLNWSEYKFGIIFQGSRLEIEVKEKEVGYSLIDGNPVSFSHQDKEIFISPGEQVVIPIN
ncbi:MAG: glycosyl hydrolase family 65 protein [Bacillota bacterium]